MSLKEQILYITQELDKIKEVADEISPSQLRNDIERVKILLEVIEYTNSRLI